MSKTVTVGISDLNVTKAPDVLVTYALGSCVGICLYDKVTRVGGLAHIMLPSSKDAVRSGDIYKFADTAIPELVRRMEELGAIRSRIVAKIAGGAQMFAAISSSSIANIGQRNITAVRDNLAMLRIPITGEDVGADYGRTLYFYTQDGSVRIRSANRGEWVW
ncbi:MAG: chemotaxis protein CheD [Eubacteriales bacterium]|jgi:chemotaxis protein CheD